MTFTARLLLLPPWLLFLLINLLFVGISIGLQIFVRRLFHHQLLERHNQLNGSIISISGTIFGVMVAFLVIFLWQDYQKAVNIASGEGSEAEALYRDLNLFPDAGRVFPAKKALSLYIRKVIEDEYPAMAMMKQSPVTQQAMDDLWNKIKKLRPANPYEEILFREILTDLNNLEKLRQERLEEMESSLPISLWLALLTGALITMMFSVLFGAERFWLHCLLTGMLAVLIATIFFVIIELNYPFMGEICAKPTAYMKLLAEMG
jgi:heme/copper-type cytochrome/quinol oxidase subunit 1